MGSGVLWKTIVTEHSLTLHQEMLRLEKALHLSNASQMSKRNVCFGKMNPCFSLFSVLSPKDNKGHLNLH